MSNDNEMNRKHKQQHSHWCQFIKSREQQQLKGVNMQSEFSYCLHSLSAYTDLWPQYPNILSVNHKCGVFAIYKFVSLCMLMFGGNYCLNKCDQFARLEYNSL